MAARDEDNSVAALASVLVTWLAREAKTVSVKDLNTLKSSISIL